MYSYFVCSSLDFQTLMIMLFYCGHQLILARYNSVCMNILILLVALVLIFMDVHTVKVCSQLASKFVVNWTNNLYSCIISD